MKKIALLLSLFGLCLFAGCAVDHSDEISGQTENIVENVSSSQSVSVEGALADMYSLMDDLWPGTRASSKSIKSVELLGQGNLPVAKTRSGKSFPDSLLYLVNFDEGGFAVLGANVNLAPVIAITTSGGISQSDFMSPSTWSSDFTLEDLWVEDDQDYLLGGIQDDRASSFVASLLLNYANATVNDPVGGGIYADDGSGSGVPGGPGGDYTGVTYEWVTDYQKPALLSTRWHQSSPFNDFVEFFKPAGTAAGCVAIATMQIMGYHEHPVCTDLYYKDGDNDLKAAIAAAMGSDTDGMTWAGLKGSDLNNTSNNARILPGSRAASASISLHIGKDCNMMYNIDGDGSSFATPNQAKKYLARRGYITTRYDCYYGSKIISEVEANRPVFIGALGDFKFGHAWVIDGYMKRHERKTAIRDSDGQRTIVQENVREQKLVHCNWGWRNGSCNGYYVSDTFFSPGDGNEVPDNGAGSNSGYYSWWFRTVTAKLK